MSRWIPALLISTLVIVAALAVSCGTQSGGSTAQAAQAPGFELEDVSGGTVDFSQFKGKVVLVDFWATWCPPCRRSIPHLNELHNRLSSRGFEVVGISLDNLSKDSLASFARAQGMPYKVLIGNLDVAKAWNIGSGIPVAILVNRDGAVVDKVVGFKDVDYWEKKVAQYL